jgi:hypothetical protein
MVEIVLSLEQSHQLAAAVVQVISIVAILKLVVRVVVVRALQHSLNALVQLELQDKETKVEM